MSELAEMIADSDELWCGEGIDARKVLIYKIEMKRSRLAELPDDFVNFLKECNGVRGSGCKIFAVNPDGPFSDLIHENLKNAMADTGALILGYNDFDYLVYDSEAALYQLRDKNDMALNGNYADWDSAAAALLPL